MYRRNMDPITSGIISGLVVNAISKIASPLATSRPRPTGASLPEYGPLALAIMAGLESTGLSNIEKQRICDFNRTDLASTVVKSVLVAQILGQVEEYDDDIRACLSAALSFYADLNATSAVEASQVLFAAYLSASQSAWQAIRDSDSRRAVATAASREYLAGQLSNIRATRDAYARVTLTDIKDYREFERKLRSQIRDRHKFIEPPDLDRKLEVPFNELYVSPYIVNVGLEAETDPTDKSAPRPSKAADFIHQIFRDVVIGDPGAGKSTLGLKVINDLTKSGDHNTPIMIILRDYARVKHADQCSIVDFIERVANSNYQVKPPRGAIEFLLHRGRLVLIFDGLDELLDTADRREVSSDVESFANLYPNTPILVTSRRVGYQQAPLNDTIFRLHELKEMDETQVRLYASRWFSLRTSRDLAAQLIEAFMADSAQVADLRSNSLMLGLLCNLYRTQRHIPRNRAEVYRACAVMLFNRWDQSRGITVQLPFRAHIDTAIKHLAYWIYTSQDRQSGVGRNKIIQQVANFLLERRYEDIDEAVDAATQFVDFCGGRAWILTDVGSTTREPLYQFTHRTFLEYFAAAHLARTNPTPSKLWRKLRPKLEREEWPMVAQLALQLQEENVESFADDFLNTLLSSLGDIGQEARKALLNFALNALSGVAPSRSVVRHVVESSLYEGLSPHFVEDLYNIAPDNIDAAAEVVSAWLEESPESAEDVLWWVDSAKVILETSYSESANRAYPNHAIRPDAITSKIWTVSGRLRRACQLELRCAISALGLGLLAFEEFFNEHGIAGVVPPQQTYINYLSPIHVALLAEMFGLERRVVDIAVGREQAIRAIAGFVRQSGWRAVRLTKLPEDLGDEPSAGVKLLSEVWPRRAADFENFTAEQQYVAIFLMCLLIDLYGTATETLDLGRNQITTLFERSKFANHSDGEQVQWWLAGNTLAPTIP